GKETEFRLPAGRWWVYLFGVYVKDNKPQGNFLTEKRVIVPRNRTGTAEFNMIPAETSVLVKVTSHGNPVYGAAVWLNQDEHKAVYTNKSASGAMLIVPRGTHIVTARASGKQVVQNLGVTSAQPMEVIVDMTHADPVSVPEVRAAGKARGGEAAAGTVATIGKGLDLHASLQGQMYDLDSTATMSQSAMAVANATRYELRKE